MLALCLLIAGTGVRNGSTIETRAPSETAAEDFEGSGFWSAVACAGCVATGFLIASSGWAGILAAASIKGSTLAVGGCIVACADALS